MAARRLRKVEPPVEHPAARDLRDAVSDALAGMDWLKPSDRALAELALKAAEQIETAQDRARQLDELMKEAGDLGPSVVKRLQKLEAMCDVVKTVGWLGPQIQGYLRDLGGTPASRRALKPDAPIGGRLDELRNRLPARTEPAGVDAPEDLDPA